MITLDTDSDGTGFFERDGRRHQIISGALHYFRVPHQLWSDRLARLAAMGCNTVETYVAWNFHQPHTGTEPDFTGDRDLGRFLDLAAQTDLDVLVRPGPYICAEWDLGGLPGWLLADPQVAGALRTRDPAYLAHVDTWLDALMPVIAARQVTHGGRVVGVQVENEYGSFGNDRGYLEHLRDGLLARGVDTLLFTSDGPGGLYLAGGTLPALLPTVNFGSRQATAFAALDEFRPGVPKMCMEFWNGWFDHWGTPHHVRDAADAAEELRQMLAAGHSVNFYMVHGGTNFGTWAGANSFPGEHGATYSPTTTSYDYDAPIAEDGTLTEKFRAFRQVIAAHTGREPAAEPPPAPTLAAQRVPLTARQSLTSVLDAAPVRHSPVPRTFEQLGVHHGVVRYRARARYPGDAEMIHLAGLADLASVSVDKEVLGHARRPGLTSPDARYVDGPVTLPDGTAGQIAEHTVDVTVHSLGRVNFGPYLHDAKGLSAVRVDFQHLFGWEQATLDLTECPALTWAEPAAEDAQDSANGAAFHRGEITVDAPADGHLDMSAWEHGYVFLNGFNLGRYWSAAGPQRSLYAPAPLWREGGNDVVVLEFGTPGTQIVLNPAPSPQRELETA